MARRCTWQRRAAHLSARGAFALAIPIHNAGHSNWRCQMMRLGCSRGFAKRAAASRILGRTRSAPPRRWRPSRAEANFSRAAKRRRPRRRNRIQMRARSDQMPRPRRARGPLRPAGRRLCRERQRTGGMGPRGWLACSGVRAMARTRSVTSSGRYAFMAITVSATSK